MAQLAQAVSQLAMATSSGSSSAAQQQWKETRFIKSPDVYAPKGIDEELGTWNEWSFAFKNWMCVQDDAYRSDFESVEAATAFVSLESYEPATRSRSLRLYSILATYLKNRPLRILRSVTNGDGYRVWRMLVDELQPSSRPRALALAQALVKFPPYREGGSLLDYTIAFERIITEYEKVSPAPYDDNLKISTLMAGLPSDIKKYLELNLDEHVTYEKLRSRLLQFEKTSTGWSSEHILRSVGIDKDSSKFLDTSGPAPIDVDRVKGDGKDPWGKKGDKTKDKGGGKYGEGKQPWNPGGKGRWGNNQWQNQQKAKGKGFGKDAKGGKAKGKGKDGGKKGKGPDNHARQVGPCYVCGRMGHVAADCRSRVSQVAEDDATSTRTRLPYLRPLRTVLINVPNKVPHSRGSIV